MKLCAVICEFNPLHNGHEYLIKKAAEISGCSDVLCVMSGNFVQRAEPAVIDKYSRTFVSLKCGAGIVVELPLIFATANASLFAEGGIDIISRFKNVTHLAFGCENNNIEALKTLAAISANESETFKDSLKTFLDKGFSYAKSYAASLSIESKKYGLDSGMSDTILSKPNNLLAIEYLKYLILKKSDIIPVPVKRIGSNYNDNNLIKNFSSATALREKIYNRQLEKTAGNMPEDMFNLLKQKENFLPDFKIFNALILDSLRNNNLDNLIDSNEGIEIKFKKNAHKFSDLKTVISETKSKRYTHAKLRRLALQSLFNITKDSVIFPSPVKILGIKKEMKKLIKSFPSPLIIQNSDYSKLDDIYNNYINIEKKAASVYSIITNTDGNGFYNNKLIEL